MYLYNIKSEDSGGEVIVASSQLFFQEALEGKHLD